MEIVCPTCKRKVNDINLLKHYKKAHNSLPKEVVKLVLNHFEIDYELCDLNVFNKTKKLTSKINKTKEILKNHFIFQLQHELKKCDYREQFKNLELLHSQSQIDKLNQENKLKLEAIRLQYLTLPSLDEFSVGRISCEFCDKMILESRLFNHIQSTHREASIENVEQFFVRSNTILTKNNLKWLKENEIRKSEVDKKRKQKEYVKRYEWLKSSITHLETRPFFETSSLFEEVVLKIECFSNDIKFGRTEEQLLSKLLTRIEFLKNELPSKKDYIINKCQSVYVSWSDLEFQKGKIKIKPSKGFFQPIPIKGSLKILNEIKISYFQRLYKDDIYKLRFTDGSVNEFVSPGLKRIRSLLAFRIKEIETKSSGFSRGAHLLLEGSALLDSIFSGAIKNSYLKIPAKMLSKEDKVHALLENNNGIHEECLLFIFQRNHTFYVLWENVNSNRAGYLFEVNRTEHKKVIGKLKNLISRNLKYKRQNLWWGLSLEKEYNIAIENYYSLVHEFESDYKWKLNSIIGV